WAPCYTGWGHGCGPWDEAADPNLQPVNSPNQNQIYKYEIDYVEVRASGQVVNESAKLLAMDGAAFDGFGITVSVSGDTAVVGAYADDGAGSDSGSAYVFRRSGSSWVQEQKLLPSVAAAGDWFGYRVSVSGDVSIVGAPNTDDIPPNSGAAYVFRFDPSQSICGAWWCEEQKLTALDAAAGDGFGSFVSVSGDVAVVGAPGSFGGNGAAYVFRWNGASWEQEQKLIASDGASIDQFGAYLSVSGDVALVGAYWDDDNGTDSGSAYVFRWHPGDPPNWSQEQKLLGSDGAAGDEFGNSVSISGNVAVVGANVDDDNGTHSGSAYVFRWNGSSWVQEQKLVAWDGVVGDEFGHAVSVSGDVAVVGANGRDDNGPQSGSAYVFRWNPGAPGPWVQELKLIPSDGDSGAFFGSAVSVFGGVAGVGAFGGDDNGPDSGSAYVFNLVCDPGYYGPMCAECPGGANNPCNGNGTCDDGPSGTGQCACNSGFVSVACEDCGPGLFGPNCGPCPGGACNPCNGNGTCDNGISGTGQCTCDPGFVGVACQDCGPGLFGPDCGPCPGGASNPCNGNGTCDDGISGSGLCTCDPGYDGPGCCTTVPAVSTWGIAVMLLLLTTTGTIVLARDWALTSSEIG
ncbi:MAG: hypothetical protein AABZ47_06440, partial [Planctomycetota bacterium]